MDMIYEEILTQDVPNNQRTAAWEAKLHAESELGIKINIVFFREISESRRNPARRFITSQNKIRGLAKRDAAGTVWIKEGMHHEEIIMVVAHEARHIWQYKHGVDDDAEADARQYSNEVTSRFYPGAQTQAVSIKKSVKPVEVDSRTAPKVEGTPASQQEILEIRSRLHTMNASLRKRFKMNNDMEVRVIY